MDEPSAQGGAAPVRVLVADDQAVVRWGLSRMVDDAEGFAVVAEAPDGERAITRAAAAVPDVVLMDVQMPGIGGIEAARRIVGSHRGAIKVLMVTTFDLDIYVFESLRAGASGFVLKDAEPDELVRAIGIVHAGESLLTPSVTRRLIAEFVAISPERADAVTAPVTPGPRTANAEALPELTAREREVVAAVARGWSNAEIAAGLHLAHTTVKSHVSSALSKCGLRDRVQLVVRAFETGLVTLDP